jgi:hypothetical protein
MNSKSLPNYHPSIASQKFPTESSHALHVGQKSLLLHAHDNEIEFRSKKERKKERKERNILVKQRQRHTTILKL